MKLKSKIAGKAVYVVDGCRTPFLKAKGTGPFSASDLAVLAGQALLNRQSFMPNDLDEVIIGSVLPGVDEANIARLIALRLGCGEKVPAYTVMRNCASGMQALDSAAQQIASGRSQLILAGGTDAMSRAPLLFNEKMTAWLAQWMSAKQWQQKMGLLTKFKPAYLAPVIALLRGLTDPLIGLNMGQTAEILAYNWGLTREQMDEFAARSHSLSIQAYAEDKMSEVVPIIDKTGKVYSKDDGMRQDSTTQNLAKLKPFFDKKFGMVTAGNSSQITDGASLLLLASKEAVQKFQLPVIGKIVDSEWAALNPAEMGLGPVHATIPLMQRHGLTWQDISALEINEAFAAQVLACQSAFESAAYCQKHFGLTEGEFAALGTFDFQRLNQDGGAIAIGHPVGASGARIVLHTLKQLASQNKQHGIASICIGGGQGGAIYVQRTTEVE